MNPSDPPADLAPLIDELGAVCVELYEACGPEADGPCGGSDCPVCTAADVLAAQQARITDTDRLWAAQKALADEAMQRTLAAEARIVELENGIRAHRDANDGTWMTCSDSCPKGCGHDRRLYRLLGEDPS